MNQYATRVRHLKAEGAYAVLARANELEAQGRDIIHLEIGQPDFQTFANIGLAGIRAIADGHTRYTPPAGTPAIRKAVAQYTGARLGVEVDWRQVVVGPGAKPLLTFPMLALIEPGDEVLYPDPGFPTYRDVITMAGGVPRPVPLRESSGFSFDLDAFDALLSDKTRLIILNSPANPTGGVIPAADLEYIADAAQARGAWVISDEIYTRLIYGMERCPSIASLPGMMERTIVVDGFSKTYAMTGWRLGYGVMPAGLADRVALLLTHAVGSTAAFTQIAGIEALTGPQDQVEAVRAEYARRRDVMVKGLTAIPGVACQTPQGAFYAFPNITALGKSSDEMANYLLEEAGVALLPGTAFGGMGEGYLRLVFANSVENIERALAQIKAAVARL
ncbi:MAG: pyridoxal phosphate-dependent aminotransferase [Anaerolineae bacterium]|nr:pyridoxal phosphate-dependent aminotransferase [Anaerolineae bacterium]